MDVKSELGVAIKQLSTDKGTKISTNEVMESLTFKFRKRKIAEKVK